MRLKPLMVTGILLIVLGALGLAWQRITYTERETVIDVGPVRVTAEKEKSVPLPPIFGGLAVATGIILVVIAAKRP